MGREQDTVAQAWREDELWLAPLPRTVGVSRLFVRDALRSWGVERPHRETAELVVSELATNAVKTSGVTVPPLCPADGDMKLIGIRLQLLTRCLFIEVCDGSPELPLPLPGRPGAEHGWGLRLVESMSIRWGFSRYRLGGKIVWCLLDVSPLPLPKRQRTRPRAAPARAMDDPAVLRHVLAGLQALPA